MRTLKVTDAEFEVIVKALNNLEGHLEGMLDGIKDLPARNHYKRSLELTQDLNHDPYSRFNEWEDEGC